MAQQETGYGWSAEAGYLRAQSNAPLGSVTIFGGTSFPGQPPGESDGTGLNVVANGIFLFSYDYRNDTSPQTRHREHYFARYQDRNIVCFRYSNHYVFASDTSGQTGWNSEYTPNKLPEPTASAWAIQTNTYNSTYQLYYADIAISSMETNPSWNPDISEFNSRDEGLAAVQRNAIAFTKDSDGYSVACWAKWYNQGGVKMQSPVLISSSNDYIDIATTGTGLYSATASKLFAGITFKMRFYQNVPEGTATSSVMVVDLTENGNIDLDTVFSYIISTTYAHVIVHSPPDPYEEEGGANEEEGGQGENVEDDEMGIEEPQYPSATSTGFCRIFCPSLTDLQNLSSYLWGPLFDLSTVKRLFADPMDSILGLSRVPVSLIGTQANVYVGGVNTGLTMPQVSDQIYTLSLGSLTVNERWGSYLDYEPYTKYSIYLPFIGFRELAADDIVGQQLGLIYTIDILSGACVAKLQAGANMLYQWGGQCAAQVPINAANWDSVFRSAVSAVSGVVTSAITGGSAGPVLAGAVASAATQAVSMKPTINRGGGLSGTAGMMGNLRPYIIRTMPEQAIPGRQNHFIGYPAFITKTLGDISGYNEIASVHLEGVPATEDELTEIEYLLKGGVIL